MTKKSINLLIEAEPESSGFIRIKKISPIISIALLGLFLVIYTGSIIYLRANSKDYLGLIKQVEVLEGDINRLKSTESIYLTTIGILETISKITSENTNLIVNSFPVIYENGIYGVNIKLLNIESKGPASIILNSNSIDALINFVNWLERLESENRIGHIEATGIVREADGSYNLSIQLIVNPNT